MQLKHCSLFALAAVASAADPATKVFNNFNTAVQSIRAVIEQWDGSVPGLIPIISQTCSIADVIKSGISIALGAGNQDDDTIMKRIKAANDLSAELKLGFDAANSKRDKFDALPALVKPAFQVGGNGVSVMYESLKSTVLSSTQQRGISGGVGSDFHRYRRRD